MTDLTIAAAAEAVRAARASGHLPVIRTFFDVATFTATHVVHDPASGHAAVVDPVCDFDQASGRTSHASADAVIAYIREHKLTVRWLLETHAHADHLSDAPYLQMALGGKIAIGSEIVVVQQTFGELFNEPDSFARDGSQFDQLFADGARFRLGELEATVLHVPGHTPACIAYVIGDALFIGDTLFMPDYGTARADFPGGNARLLFRSIRRLMTLPDETRVFLCHDYKSAGRDDYAWETTIGAERTGNVHVHAEISEDAFVAMREARDATLGMPRLILPSIQVNIRAGHLPEPEANGICYLKLPLNLL
ncbi:MAG: MBL fold metallo-hydrolase [Sphingomonadales bacterium]|nr:MBL fold metallo-hydrolase [Sphingomonadales bacterium]